jgi:dimethylaniline monooxygenase (N-oxide forming)
VIKTELWDTITRRGILGNLLMAVIPMGFYLAVNLAAFVVEMLWVSGRNVIARVFM